MNARRRNRPMPPVKLGYTVEEVHLLTTIPMPELYAACRNGELQHIRRARGLVVPAFAVDEYLRRRTAETMRTLGAAV